MNKELDKLFDHPCKQTCSGWQQGYQRGFNANKDETLRQMDGWIELLELNHKVISESKGYADQNEADREHGNSIRLLKTIVGKLLKAECSND